MLGFKAATLSAAYILASTACTAPAPPAVDLQFTSSPPVQRTDLSSKELGGYHISTTFSHSRNETFTVGGLTVSDFVPQYVVDFEAETGPDGNACLSMKTVTIKVNYAPTIFVASDYKEGTCKFQLILQHEARHVNTDIITFNEMLPALKKAVQDGLAGAGAAGPMPTAQFTAAQDAMVDEVKQAMTGTAETIEKTRAARQQAIDTRQEYMRISQACPDEYAQPQ